MKIDNFNTTYVFILATITAMGGLLFGYDWVVIGGAKPFYEVYFGITEDPTLQGWAVSSALIGCIIGAISSGVLADTWGRKKPLMLTALLFGVSAWGSGAVDQYLPFIGYRILGGIGIGLASALSPMYIAEVAPSKYRGRFVSLNQFTIVLGILLAQITNFLIAEPINTSTTGLESWNVQFGWRYMFWGEMIPASLFFLLMIWVPESPRFLIKVGKMKSARIILSRIGGNVYSKTTAQNITGLLNNSKASTGFWKTLSHNKKLYPILLLGIVLAVFQQWCGINIIFNYADEIFSAAGYEVGDMLFNVVITGAINLIFTLVAMKTVDNWGRRNLMLTGAFGLAFTYALLGSAYYFGFSGWPILVLVLLAIAIYAMSLAPITWVILSEIFPNQIRGTALALATFFLWVASFILTFTFPILNDLLKASGIFWVYSGICVLGFLFIRRNLPETKGKTLEELEIKFLGKHEE